MIDLSDESKLNAVMRRIISYRAFMQNFIDAVNDTTEGLGYRNYLRLLREFYNADCVAVIYNGESAWDTIEEIHIPSAKIMAKVVMNLFQEVQLQIFSLFLMTLAVCL